MIDDQVQSQNITSVLHQERKKEKDEEKSKESKKTNTISLTSPQCISCYGT